MRGKNEEKMRKRRKKCGKKIKNEEKKRNRKIKTK